MRVNSSLSCLGIKLCCLSVHFIFMSSLSVHFIFLRSVFHLDEDKIWVVFLVLIVFLDKVKNNVHLSLMMVLVINITHDK